MSDVVLSERLTEYFKILANNYESDEKQERMLCKIVAQEFDGLDAELQRLIRTKLPSRVEIAEAAIEDLLVYCKMDINSYLDLFFELTKEYVPITIFRGANDENKARLKARLSPNNYRAVRALAYCADEFAVRQFLHWKIEKPVGWSEHETVEYYTQEAGWELNEHNQIRNLYRDECHPIKVSLERIADSIRQCEKCDRTLNVLEVEEYDGKRFLEFCDLCVGRECLTETPKWIKKAPSIGANFKVAVGSASRDKYFAINQFLRHAYSQRGGLPCWIQENEYPKCARCNRTMIFVLQIEGLQIEHSFDWTFDTMYYLFRCEFCTDQFRVTQQFS